MTKGPRCRLCEHEHWSYEPHVFGSAPVTKVAVAPTVAIAVTKRMGRPRVYETNAARSAAYRARKKAAHA
jgi:hypothetical protein